MSPEAPAWMSGQHRRMLALVTVVPYPSLAVLVVVTLIVKRGTGGSLLIDLGLCAAAALWILCMFSLRRDQWDQPGAMGVFVAGLLVLVGVLVARDPWFGLFTPVCYVYSFGILPWPWRLPSIAAVAVESGLAQAAGISRHSMAGVIAFTVVLAVNVICMCGLAWWEWDADRKNEQRKAALEQVREANLRLEATLAENAGLQRQLLVQAREAGVLDERQRMAREIHDTLAQGLIGIITQLQAAERAVGPAAAQVPESWRAHFATATGLARESLAEARRSVDALRPEPLQTTAGLGEALEAVARRWSARHGVALEAATTGTARPMPPEIELALLRAAQEALANVARHARAGNVTLTLRYLDDEVTLDVCDDGCGFDPSPALPAHAVAGVAATVPAVAVLAPLGSGVGSAADMGGFGLTAMRERIEGLSGALRVQSAPGAGTIVSARVPHRTAQVGV